MAEGFLNELQLQQALQVGSQTGERLGEVVVREGLASEEDIACLLAEQWNLSYVDRSSIWFDANALARLSREDAQRLEAMPTRVQDGRVVVAVAEPTEQRLAALREVIGEDTVVVVVPKTALEAGLHSQLLASDGRIPPARALDSPWERDDDPADAVARELERPTSSRRRADPPHAPTARTVRVPATASEPRAPDVTGSLAQSLAELIEAQIGASREPSADDTKKLAALELRIGQLESELGSNRAALAEMGKHLQAIAGLLGKLSGR